MCESCRKRHFSVRQCRLVLQHTDPEWQPAQPPPAVRRRRRKQPAANTTKQFVNTFGTSAELERRKPCAGTLAGRT
ncbi:hypothetical protein JG687_00013004 [Phytophthora cactorum]|uniref:Uncharacterized protein n=2 Tax=Phytophthora TaxID=4783 RepID=A0A8J5INL1_9STRA|nr:hypothetical protein JG687_00013004 [Phytophthora cactorum]KAG6955229.1 hypothetical protein JG688_00011969 [Phytophthora aleatoria]